MPPHTTDPNCYDPLTPYHHLKPVLHSLNDRQPQSTKKNRQPSLLNSMEPHPVRFVDNAHVLMSNGWIARGAPSLLRVCSSPP